MDQVVAIAAVVAGPTGIVIGWGLNELSARARWKREQSVRWLDDRRHAYGRFHAAIQVVTWLAEVTPLSEPEERDRATRELFASNWALGLLAGSTELRLAATKAARDVSRWLRSREAGEAPDEETARDSVAQFELLARMELGTTMPRL